VVGVIIGRIGDLIIADHLGRPTDFVLGYRIPDGVELAPGYGPPTYVPGAVVHQTALYDLVGALVLLGVIYLVGRKPRPAGTLFAVFSLWYGLQRFLIDFTRNREVIESSFGGLSGSQWAGLAFALGGAVGLVMLRRRSDGRPAPAEREAAPVAAAARPNALEPTPPAEDTWTRPAPQRTTPTVAPEPRPDPFAPPAPAAPVPQPPAPQPPAREPEPPAPPTPAPAPPPPAPQPQAPPAPAPPAPAPAPAPTEPIHQPERWSAPASEPATSEPASEWAAPPPPPPPPPAPAPPAAAENAPPPGGWTEADLALPPQPAAPASEPDEDREKKDRDQAFGEEPPPGA
jgi:hypothetical protein